MAGGDVFRVTLEMIPGSSTSLKPLLHRLRQARIRAARARDRVIGKTAKGAAGEDSAGSVAHEPSSGANGGVSAETSMLEDEESEEAVRKREEARARRVLEALMGAKSKEEVEGEDDEEERAIREEIERLGSIEAATTDNGDGSYTVTYVPGVAGQYRIKIEVRCDTAGLVSMWRGSSIGAHGPRVRSPLPLTPTPTHADACRGRRVCRH